MRQLSRKNRSLIILFGTLSFVMVAALWQSAKAETKLSVTPRFWYTFLNDSQFYPNDFQLAGGVTQTGTVTSQSVTMPMYGGTFSLRSDALGDASFSLTALYGEGSGKNATTLTVAQGFFILPVLIDGYRDVKRTDIEALLQFPIGNEGSNLFVGARFINMETDQHITKITANFSNFSGDYVALQKSEQFYFLEAGGGLSSALDEAGRHHLFGNMTFMLGKAKGKAKELDQSGNQINDSSNSDTLFGIDTNIGYGYSFGDQITVSARYRAIVSSPVEGWSTDGNGIVHGPEFNMTVRF